MQRKKSNNKICQRFFTLIAALSFAFLLVTSTSACIDNWNVSDREESHTACALAISDVDISSRSDVTACSVNNFDIHSQKLAVGGMPFGVKLSLRGVIVIGISEIQTDNGTQCPAKKAGIHPKSLSNALESAGTVTSCLVPWNTCGMYIAATLGVTTATYLPWAVFNYVTPLVTLVLAFVGVTVTKMTPEEQARADAGELV